MLVSVYVILLIYISIKIVVNFYFICYNKYAKLRRNACFLSNIFKNVDEV